ncbi:MAG: helix-turn-helix domain containing protein [Actinomycetota bacterium]|nr:helix-turn-helix domain containing protein [Actinomycetota bacterium]
MGSAAELFVERGFHAVSMRDIAAAADLTKGALYGHFRSKGQLLVEVIRWLIAERDQTIDFERASAVPEEGVELMFEARSRDIRLLEVDAAAAARHDPDVAAGLAEFYLDRHKRITEAASESTDPDTAAWVITYLQGGIGLKEAVGLPLPQRSRLRRALAAATEALA